MRPAIVRRDHLDVLASAAAIRLFVLDANVRKVQLVIEVRQLVLARPLPNLIGCAIRVPAVVVVVFAALVQPPLVLALELVVENDALDLRAAVQEAPLGVFVGAIDLNVVLQLAPAYEARVEGLRVIAVAVTVALQPAAALLGQDYRVIAISRHADGLDQTLFAKVPQVA
jgi:hypothetical protein